MGRIGIFGYGNPLRGDDGVGWHVADAVGRCWPAVIVRTAHQVVPEWAAEIAELDVAYFVDASVASRYLRLRHIVRASDAAPVASHMLEPEQVVRLSVTVYGRAPEAYVVHVPAHDFAFGAGLSSVAARGAALAIALLNRRLEELTDWSSGVHLAS